MASVIPDETNLGQRVVARRRVATVDDRSGSIDAQSTGDAAERIGQRVKEFAAHDDQFNYARARSALQTADAAARKALEQDPQWQTHESRYAEQMKVAREEAGKLISGSRSRALFDLDAKNDIDRGTEQIRGNARRVEGQWGRSELDSTLEGNRRAALETADEASRKALIDSSAASIRGALDKQYITPEQAVQVEQAWKANYGEGFVEMKTPGEQMKLLKAPKGTPADFIDPAKRAQMLERLVDKQRVAVDRREARAERSMAAWQRQISSGVPTTAEMRTEWSKDIAGTSVQGELNELLAGEKEVQETLRKPIGEQIRLAQEKEATLMKSGGTMAQAANVARLQNAVKQNVALLRDSPLLFAEKRLEEPNTPIDLNTINDPDKQVETAAIMQERAAQIRTLSKHFDTNVPMKPLLPQEALQLSGALDGASPAQSAQLLASLREASGSSDVFKGAMQQIAPDSPVKAVAGLLAAQQRDLTTATHWFTPDESVTSRNVSATLLQGDRLLNPSKGDKAQDGKPQAKNIYLPDQDALQQRFADEVGNAFAGRPVPADTALQAVRAYYVGRAAQIGRVASDETDVDPKLVKEAVRNTLGNVIDYNGAGSVLAPWGMSESDFEDRAETALAAKAKELKLTEFMGAEIDTFGLTNAGADGQYAVTLGRKPVFDAHGNPVVIDIKPRDARDQKGYIDRGGK